MNYKIIWWITAAFNSAFNGNGMINHSQALVPNSNIHPVASSRFSDVTQPHDPDGMVREHGLTENELLQGVEGYNAFIKQYIDPDFEGYDEHVKSHKKDIQTKKVDYCAVVKQESDHKQECITAYGKTKFCFKFDAAFSDDEVEELVAWFQRTIDTYERSIAPLVSTLEHKHYVHKWDDPEGNVHGSHQLCGINQEQETMYHVMKLFLSKSLPHTPGHEMGHALHYAHTKSGYIPPLISDGIAEYVSLSFDQKCDAAVQTLNLFQNNPDFAALNASELFASNSPLQGDYHRYIVGPMIIQYMQECFPQARLVNNYLNCRHLDNQNQCSSTCRRQLEDVRRICAQVPLQHACQENAQRGHDDCRKQCSNACANDHFIQNINMADFRRWLERTAATCQASKRATLKPHVATYRPIARPVVRPVRHTVMPSGYGTVPTPIAKSVEYLDLVCNDTQGICTQVAATSPKIRYPHRVQGNHVHTEDCVHVTIHNQTTNAKKTYACNSGWHQWLKDRIKAGAGRIAIDYVCTDIPFGCKLLQETPADAISTPPSDKAGSSASGDAGSSASGDAGSSASGSMLYWVPAAVGGSVATFAIGAGVRKCYNKWG